MVRHFIALSQIFFFFTQIEGKTFHQEKITARYLVTFALLQWSKTEPAGTPRCACAGKIGSDFLDALPKSPQFSSLYSLLCTNSTEISRKVYRKNAKCIDAFVDILFSQKLEKKDNE